ncbi:hypothetical protein BBBOND_0201150 [Babesia bigemina]|uniref:Uncharacterized protein n=1 Tax=Babesia bigemina TaxID=5866 RepID=A0A061D2W7_BABBI|nr:hypothetical protein BBBOND_0201150 [Babesia bigemina]CDR94958.1 hypothetical protein BBBOND_0201150 [Babesia bigemina]|eukprot:XP_012767144.1 hypothetical protein BBBOND_0201150 [Babesia bigemina]
MAPIRSYGRRWVVALFGFYAVGYNGLAGASPMTDEQPGNVETPAKGIAFYADNAEFYRRVKRLETLSRPQNQLWSQLMSVLLNLRQSTISPKIKEAIAEECRQLIRDIEDITSLHDRYTELREIINEYSAVTRCKKRKSLTRERYAELQNALTNLEEQFKDIEQVASEILRFDNAAHFRAVVRQASIFIRQHTGQGSTQSDDEGSSGLGGDKQATLESDTVNSIGVRPNDLHRNDPRSDEGNETMRELLNDRSLFKTLGYVNEIAKKIDAILKGPLVDNFKLHAAGSVFNRYNAVILDVQRDYDMRYDEIRDLTNAWNIYKRYAYINDMLQEMDPQSTKASRLIDEQRQLEVAFEEYGTIVDVASILRIDWDAWSILRILRFLEAEMGQTQANHTVSIPQPEHNEVNETATETAMPNDSNTTPNTTEPKEPTQKPEPKTTKESTPEPSERHVTAEGEAGGASGGPQETGNLPNTMRKTKRDSDKSGIVAMGTMVIQIMVATNIMVAL